MREEALVNNYESSYNIYFTNSSANKNVFRGNRGFLISRKSVVCEVINISDLRFLSMVKSLNISFGFRRQKVTVLYNYDSLY